MKEKEYAYIRVVNAAYHVALKHTRRELIEHTEWRELENSLSEIIRINNKAKEENKVGFHIRKEN